MCSCSLCAFHVLNLILPPTDLTRAFVPLAVECFRGVCLFRGPGIGLNDACAIDLSTLTLGAPPQTSQPFLVPSPIVSVHDCCSTGKSLLLRSSFACVCRMKLLPKSVSRWKLPRFPSSAGCAILPSFPRCRRGIFLTYCACTCLLLVGIARKLSVIFQGVAGSFIPERPCGRLRF